MQDLSQYKTKILARCVVCDKEFFTRPGEVKRGKGKLCSNECRHLLKKKTIALDGHPNWKGGIMIRAGVDYVHVNVGSGRYIQLHRLVMEEKIGRRLLGREVVHHWDEKKQNNEEKNLGLFRHQAAHARMHAFSKRHGMKVNSFLFPQTWLSKG